MRRIAWACLASLLLMASTLAVAQQGEDAELLRRATDSYASALDSRDRDERLNSYRNAQRHFAALTDRGYWNPDLLTDLGNAALLGEDSGQAVLAYRRALVLDPDHRAATSNLAHARAGLPEWVPRPETISAFDSFFFWHRGLASGERSALAACMFALAAALLAASIYWNRAGLRQLAILPGLVWLATAASLAIDFWFDAPPAAVVTVPEVVARAADSANSPAAIARPLVGGVEVAIVETRSGWVRIALADGREAWIPESALTRVEKG